jgi:hypothetical protein
MKNFRLLNITILTGIIAIACNTGHEMKPVPDYKEETRATEEAFKNAAARDGVAEALSGIDQDPLPVQVHRTL